MRILLVKTTSLGDVIHNLPVVNDIRRHLPDAVIDWCVEDSFGAIPRLHPGVRRAIGVNVRRWRKRLLRRETWAAIANFRKNLRLWDYDLIIDTQGLLKSAFVAIQARGPRAGYARDSAREPLASLFYQQHYSVPRDLHAVQRNRRLVAAALGYSVDGEPDYGISAAPGRFPWRPDRPCVVFLTASSRDDKLWPDEHWLLLGQRLHALGFSALLPAGTLTERERAERLAAAIPGAVAVPPLDIPQLAALIGEARAVVGVDTGLTHLAAALGIPTVALYTASEPGLTGVLGRAFHRNLGGRGQIPGVDAVYGELQLVLGG